MQARLLLDLLARRWTPEVLNQIGDEGRHFGELLCALEDISHKVLTDTLRRAERDGLITRELHSAQSRATVRYALTDLGRSLEDPLTALDRWTHAHWAAVEAARRRWDADNR